MRRFYAGPGGAPATRPYVESDVYANLSAIEPGEWRALIRRHLEGLGPQALLAGLESSGWRLAYSAEKNSYIESEEKRHKSLERQWSIGLRLNDKGVILDTIEDRAAARAGAGPGMTVIAVNGREYRAEVLDAAIAAAQQTRTPIGLLVKIGGYYRTLAVAYFDGARFPHLTRIAGHADILSEVLKARRG
ncbi:MAG: peptidase M61, partial [Steroidobacteraceae bacterium]